MFRRTYLVLFVVLMAALVLAACGGGAAPTATPVPPTEPPAAAPTDTPVPPTEVPPTNTPEPAPTEPPAPAGTLRIWADDTRAPILQELAPDFLAAYNIELVVELKSAIRDDFQVAAPVGEGPDIIVIAHDQAGTLVDNGLLAEVDLGDMADQFSANALAACTFGGKLYCMPYATENMAFFYNTDLVPEAPATWDDVMTAGKALIGEGKATYVMAVTGTTYDAYPIFTAFGGYIFGRDADGNWDPQDLGVDSEGMIAGVKFLADGVAAGEFPKDWDWANNHALFETGEVPFLMAGPWALDRIRQSGVPYAISNFPAGPAGEGFPFAGTQGFFINGLSENVLLAQAFLTEFVATEETMQALYKAGGRPSAFLPVLEATDDPDLAAFGKAGANATMMPAIPAMGSVWGNWNDSVVLARDAKQDSETAMKAAGTKIRSLISGVAAGMVNVPGSYQAAAGCSGDWQPDCEATAMTKGEDGLFTSGPFKLAAGDYEAKVAMDGAWTLNYGMEGKQDGDNYKFSLTADGEVSFSFDPATNLLTINVK